MFNEALALQIADMVDESIFVVNHNLLVYYNHTASQLIQRINKNFDTDFEKPFFSKFLCIDQKKIRSWQRAMAVGKVWNDRVDIRIGNRTITLSVKVRTTDGHFGKQGSYIFAVKEVVDQQQTTEDTFLSRLVDNAPFMLIKWNDKREVAFANRACLNFLEQSSSSTSSLSLQEVHSKNDIQQLCKHIDGLRNIGEYSITETRIAQKDKSRRAFWINGLTENNDGSFLYYSVGVDTSGRHFWNNDYELLRQHYNTLTGHLNYPLFILNKDMEVTYANDPAVKWFKARGLTPNANPNAIFDLSEYPRAAELKAHFTLDQQTIKPRIFVSEDKIFERFCYPLMKNGKIESLMVEVRKVKGFNRELMLLDIEGELPHSILETAKASIVRLNEEMEIVYANTEFATLLQYSPLDLIGTYVPNIIANEYKEPAISNFNNLIAGNIPYYNEDSLIIKKDGTMVCVEVLVKGVRRSDGSFSSITATLNDITKRKKHEEQLKQKLNQTQAVKENMDKFYSVIGHDLRNPLLTTKLISESLLQHNETKDSATLNKYLRYISSLAENSLDLIDNLISWTKSVIEGIEYKPTYFSLNQLSTDIEKHFNVASQLNEVTIVNHVPKDIRIFADRNMLKTVLRNLVSNAIKYSNAGGIVTLNAALENDKIEISVSDKGIGIDEKTIQNLFKRGAERDVSASSKTSSGIGLLICHHFVERHGGDISVESTIGQGTTIRVTLNARK